MSVSPRKTRNATGALRNRTTAPVPVAHILPGGEIPIRDLKYELHSVSLKSLAKELETDQKYDSEDEGDEQGPLMERIMKEVVEWLPDIWLAMAEENEDMDLIRGCLNLCSSAANDLLVITNSGKKIVYNQSYYVVDYMAWMWREFLVFSVIRGCPVSACEIIKDDEIYEQVFSLFRQNTSDPKNEDGYAFWDDHWSQEMKTVADCLYPEHAAEILAAARQTEDIIHLFDHLTEKDSSLHTPAILVTVRYLSKVYDKKHRSRVLQIVENGHKSLKREALDAVHHLFPGLADAEFWLRRLRDAGSFTFDDNIFHDSYDERDTNLRCFAERAANEGPLTDPNWASPTKNRRKIYSEDSYYEAEPQSSERDLAQSIRGWAQVLSALPDQKAAADVWNRVKFDDSELLFSAVSGAEEALIDRIEQADLVQSDKWLQIISSAA
ncbi:hypothetical protein EV421DRAFT_2023964 [Armillaria borealis]|uniref:Uncharacterized protein n=1 Tax=Armillaria borealis TaxID=47425 RepID=A0AA39J138_9AGAR|nr:hypothetical protein EV421DRAFT_2023964 [Armillaria borealis]